MPSVNAATFMITLSDKTARSQTIWQVIDSVQAEALHTIPGIRRLQIKEMGSDVMASSMAPIQLLVFGKDLAERSPTSATRWPYSRITRRACTRWRPVGT